MEPIVDIIIPTWNNPEFVNPCVQSIIHSGALDSIARLIIVNNGDEPLAKIYAHFKNILVVEAPRDGLGQKKNLGWEGGLKLGLENSRAQFVVFQNDDTFLPPKSDLFYHHLLTPFTHPQVGIVSPVTTIASGMQSIYHPACPRSVTEASYLIFFCVMVRRSFLDELGGIDTTLPGGDDIDLSIRMRQAGKVLLINPDAFLIHHGFKTGTRVHGDGYAGVKGGWNSPEMIEITQRALINKHGFKNYITTMMGYQYDLNPKAQPAPDTEGETIRMMLNGDQIIYELGCGGQKTIPHAFGVDRVPFGEKVPGYNFTSVAEVQADITEELPFAPEQADAIVARHSLEHCVDTVEVVKRWQKYLKPGGKLIVAVPDEAVTRGIPLDPTHCHAFSKKSIQSLMEACGFKTKEVKASGNNISLVGCFIKHENGTQSS